MSELGPDVLAYVMANFGDDYVFDMAISYLPCQVFERLTFDQAAKIRHSASRNFDSKTHDAFDANPSHELLRKIKSSIWRWSLNDKSWNEVVDAYAAISSEERRVGKACVSTCRSRGSPQHKKKNTTNTQ